LLRNNYIGVRIGNNEVLVNLLQFVNDTLFFCEAKVNNIIAIKSMLRCFELESDLRINFYKCKIGGVILDLDALNNYVMISNCSHVSILFKYLGMSIEGNLRKMQFWQEVVEKIINKLPSWRGGYYLSQGGFAL